MSCFLIYVLVCFLLTKMEDKHKTIVLMLKEKHHSINRLDASESVKIIAAELGMGKCIIQLANRISG